MQLVEVSLVEYLDGGDGGVRLLGRSNDPEVILFVREFLARERRAELARLEPETGGPSVRLVPPSEDEESSPEA